jgi:hypothetical protein
MLRINFLKKNLLQLHFQQYSNQPLTVVVPMFFFFKVTKMWPDFATLDLAI